MRTKPLTASLIAAGTILGGAGSAFASTAPTSTTAAAPSAPAPTSTSTTTTTIPTLPPVTDACGADSHWPGFVQGVPDTFDSHDNGVYIGHVPPTNGKGYGWGLRVSHPLAAGKPAKADFSGVLVTDGQFADVQRIKDEKDDVIKVSPDGHFLYYNFVNYGWVDGVNFRINCPSIPATGTSSAAGSTNSSATSTVAPGFLGFDLWVDGSRMDTKYIHLGDSQNNPKTDPFLVRRLDTDMSTQPMPPVTSTTGAPTTGGSSSGGSSGGSSSTGSVSSAG